MNVVVSPVILERVPHVKGTPWWKRLLQPQLWVVRQDVIVCIGEWTHTIPAGLVTDFASVPRCVKWLLPDTINYGTAALVHDNLYKNGNMGKIICDAVLKGMIQDLDEGTGWQAEIVFLSVHVFGWFAWRGHRKRETAL